jgi:hypothetical protein
MSSLFATSLAFVPVSTVWISTTGAQSLAEGARAADVARLQIPKPLPFKVGETLTYEVSFSKLFLSGSIGRLTMSVEKPADNPNTGLIELKAEAVSRGFFTWLFGIKVRDRFRSIVNPEDFGLHTSVIEIEEGARKKEQKSVIDRETGRVTYSERDLVAKSAEPNIKQAESPRWVQDALSAIYLVRTQQLKQGERLTVPISDAAKVYEIEVIADKPEQIKVDAGKFQALKLEAKIFDGRYINKKGEMVVWFSDDGLRLPLKARIKTGGTTVTVQLSRIHQR